jgi:hypothetical protein
MQRTADFHDQIADTRLPEAAGLVDDVAALDAAVDVLEAHAPAGDAAIAGFLGPRQGPAPWLPGLHDDLDVVECERQETQILEQAAPRGQGVRGRLGNPLIMGAAGIRVAQKENRERRIDQQDVFDRVACFLAAITARLLSGILGARDAPFGPIVTERGESDDRAGAAAGGSDVVGAPSVGTTRAAASASATPRRCASSVKDRVGASPSARSVACSTTKRT